MTDEKRRVLAFLFENGKQQNNYYARIESAAIKLKLSDMSSKTIDLVLDYCYSEREISAEDYEDVGMFNNRYIRLTEDALRILRA